MQIKASNGIACSRSGHGSPVVLLHGVGLRAESWFSQIQALSKTHTVYAPDMPGHGESAKLGGVKPALVHFVGQIGTFIEETVTTPAVIVGHSMGAMVALGLASRAPGFCAGVAALNAVYRRSPEARKAVRARADSLRHDAGRRDAAAAAAAVNRWFGEKPAGHARDMAELCRKWLTETDPESYAAAYSVFAVEDGPPEAALAGITAPALFLTGENDRNSTPDMSRAMAKTAAHGEAVVIAGARHMAQLTHAAEVNDTLCAFVAGCRA